MIRVNRVLQRKLETRRSFYIWFKLFWNISFRERERACEGERKAGISGWSVRRGYRRVTEASNLITIPGITCIKSGKDRELSKNSSSSWFGYKFFVYLYYCFFFFPFLKPASVPVLALHSESESLSRLLALFCGEWAILWLIRKSICDSLVLHFWWKWKNMEIKISLREEKRIFWTATLKKQSTRELTKMKILHGLKLKQIFTEINANWRLQVIMALSCRSISVLSSLSRQIKCSYKINRTSFKNLAWKSI